VQWRLTITATPAGVFWCACVVGRRWQALASEIAELDTRIKSILDESPT